MNLKTLILRNFRNYEELYVTFSPKVNTIHGENAQGKTNLLEAIHLLITGRSFRTTRLSDLIRFGASSFYIEAHFVKNGVEQVLKLSYDAEGRKIIHNATPLASLSSLLGILNGVILSPEDGELVKGGPSLRRQFLDLQIAQTNPLYLHHLSRYVRAMKQRNTLLKRKRLETIEIWEEQMAPSAAYITLHRLKAAQELEVRGHPLQTALSHGLDQLSLRYESSALQGREAEHQALTAYFKGQYAKQRKRESELGTTLTGPHRDDLAICVGAKSARYFASEGQQRCSVAALRLAEWTRLHELTGELPIMCLDDVGESLDHEREESLYHQLENLGQVFITSPRKEDHIPHSSHLLEIHNGSIAS